MKYACMLPVMSVGCELAPDLIAELPPSQMKDAQGPVFTQPRASDAGGSLFCASGYGSILLMDDDLALWSAEGQLKSADAVVTCGVGIRAGAIDGSGRIWVSLGSGLAVLNSMACALKLPLAPSALAFLYDPLAQREILYGLQDGTLLEIEPSSGVYHSIGTLAATYLAGSDDGRLYAFRTEAAGVFRVDEVDRKMAVVSTVLTLDTGGDHTLEGAALVGDRFAMLSGDTLYLARSSDDFETRALGRAYTRVFPSTCAGTAK